MYYTDHTHPKGEIKVETTFKSVRHRSLHHQIMAMGGGGGGGGGGGAISLLSYSVFSAAILVKDLSRLCELPIIQCAY